MLPLDRRQFFVRTGATIAAGVVMAGCAREPDSLAGPQLASTAEASEDDGRWAAVREEFALSDDYVHMSALLISSHPRPVREAIEHHRRELDRNPVPYLEQNNRRRRGEVRQAAGAYLGVSGDDIILTDSTTMGLGLVYNGLRLREGQEIVTTEGDYYVTHESLRLAAARTGATVRQITLADDLATATADEIVDNIRNAIRRETRVLAITWVHSGTGLKLPLARIAEAVEESDRGRDPGDRVLLCVDGVHGFGVEDLSLRGSRVDFFISGCHKWLFGPRGTGIVWGNGRSWHATRAIIPSFIDDETWGAWIDDTDPDGPTTAERMMPGGFKPFEHQWAMKEAFEFHQGIGKARIAARTHELARQLKEGLAKMNHISLITPRDQELSSGIVCFDVRGMSADNVVRHLRRRAIVASATPYAVRYARLTPSIRNTPEEVDRVLRELQQTT
jgi:isopenicillin-N epimerase